MLLSEVLEDIINIVPSLIVHRYFDGLQKLEPIQESPFRGKGLDKNCEFDFFHEDAI